MSSQVLVPCDVGSGGLSAWTYREARRPLTHQKRSFNNQPQVPPRQNHLHRAHQTRDNASYPSYP